MTHRSQFPGLDHPHDHPWSGRSGRRGFGRGGWGDDPEAFAERLDAMPTAWLDEIERWLSDSAEQVRRARRARSA